MKQVTSIIRSEKGIAMPLVLIVLVVLILLGIALHQYSISELDHSVREEKRTRAYYIARAGAESLARHIMRDMDILEEVPEVDDRVTFDEQDFDTDYFSETETVGEVEVELKRISETRVEVTGTGTVDDDINQNVSIVLEIQDEFDGVVYSVNDLRFNSGLEVVGDIVTADESVKFGTDEVEYDEEKGVYTHDSVEGTIKKGESIAFPSIDFPDPPEEYDDHLIISAKEMDDEPEYTIDTNNTPDNDNKGYEKISIEKHGNTEGKLIMDATEDEVQVETKDLEMDKDAKLLFETSSGHSLKLIVENYAKITKIEVTGDGIAEIYVRDEGHVNFQTPHADILKDDANLVVYLGEGSTMDLQANSNFEGLVYGPEAFVSMGGNASFKGSMIVNELKGIKGSTYIGSGDTTIDHKHSWDFLDIDYGGYYMVRWVD